MAVVRIRIAALLHSYTAGSRLVEVEADTIGGAIAALDRRFPGFAFRVVDEQHQIRPHMSIFLGEERMRDLATPLTSGCEIYIVGALSGG